MLLRLIEIQFILVFFFQAKGFSQDFSIDSTNRKFVVKQNCQNPKSAAFTEKYRKISTYIPDNKDDVKIVNINFNIFQDYYGRNNFSPLKNPQDSIRLINMLNWVNEIYNKQPFCNESNTYNSDPPKGVKVKDLDKKFIQFKLNGIYEYKDKTPDEGLWKTNNNSLLVKRIRDTDSNRLKQINICFTEKYYLGSVRGIKLVKRGKNYSQPMVYFKDKLGEGAKAFANVEDGHIKSINIVNTGKNYSDETKVIIKGGSGKGAKAIAHINEKTNTIQKIEIIDGGNNYQFTKIEITGGGGVRAAAFVDEISRGRIKHIYVSQKGSLFIDDPEIKFITDSKGTGVEAVAKVQGATGFTLTPSFSDVDLYVNEKSLYNDGNADGDYAAATNLAHELGHILDLLHTYSGGNETNNPANIDYMSDLFGNSFSGFNVINWGKDPCISSDDLVTNNLMGGNQTSQYASPMQIGKMHRALHIYNVKKYTDCTCDSKKPWFVDKDEIWDFNFKLYNPLIIKTDKTLTLDCMLEMPDNCDIIVENNAQLIIGENGVITGGCQKKWNGRLIVKKGAHFTVKPGGKYLMEDIGKLIIE